MSDNKVVSITQKERIKSESNKEDRWNKVLQNIERINEILLKAGEPSLLGFLFVDLSMLTANIEIIRKIRKESL